MKACLGTSGVNEYLERCGSDLTAYFMFFDTHIMDIDEFYKATGKYPPIMFTTDDFNHVEFNRILAYNRIALSRDEDLWLQNLCKKLIDCWIQVRMMHDEHVRKIEVPSFDDYIEQSQYIWVKNMLNRTI